MPEYCVSFDQPKANTLVFPSDLQTTGWYNVDIDDSLGVTVTGNRDGLLYLAELLVRCAITGYDPGFHVHMALNSAKRGPNIDCSPELTLYAAGGDQPID
jgi:hypothetical protein